MRTVLVAMTILFFVGGCELDKAWYELCPEPHVATASTSELIEELVGRGMDLFDNGE